MAQIETRLRAGMAANGITGPTADAIVLGITSFALYGFPESHSASFALLAPPLAPLELESLPALLLADPHPASASAVSATAASPTRGSRSRG